MGVYKNSAGKYFLPVFLRFIQIFLICNIAVHSTTDYHQSAQSTFDKGAENQLSSQNTTRSSSPSKCFKAAKRLKGFNTEDIIELCQNANSISPIECVKALPLKTETSAKILLCSSADSNIPASCYNQIKSSKVKLNDIEKAKICKDSTLLTNPAAECVNRLPRNFGTGEAIKLCAGINSIGPALCAASLKSGKNSVEIISELCHRASSKAPAECFARAPNSYHQIQKMQLCREAESEGPAECVRAIHDSRFNIQQKIDVCWKSNTTAPAKCLAALSHLSISGPEKVKLCQRASSDIPARCLKEVRNKVKPLDYAIQLCAAADSMQVVDCVKAAPYGLDSEQKLALCSGAQSSAPAVCVKRAQGKFSPDSKHLAIELCRGAESEGPLECFSRASQAFQGRLSDEQRVRLCHKAPSEAPAICAEKSPPSHRIPGDLKVELCRGVEEDGPMLCATTAPSAFSNENLLALCSGATGEVVSQCARLSPFSLSIPEKAALCTKAESIIPALCADSVGSLLPRAQTVELCQGAQNLTPAFCARHLGQYSLEKEQIQHCRDSNSVPSHLKVKQLGFEGEKLVPGAPFFVHLLLSDQFLQPMIWDNATFVTASIPVKGSNGARIGGQRVNNSVGGQVQFNDLSFDIDGVFTLQFLVNDVVFTSFRVIVGSDWNFRICDHVYDLFQCLPEEAEEAIDVNNVKTEFIAQPESRKMLGCLSAISDSGFQVTMGWGGDIWIAYPSGLDALESGYGIPTPNMNFSERLGVPQSASFSEIRKAYYKESLQWHPDRWAQFPQHTEKASEVFQLIGEAYQSFKSNRS